MEEEIHWQIAKLTKIGNSYGIILTRKMLKHMNITDSKQVGILLKNDDTLVIKNTRRVIPLNLDVSTWGREIDKAIKAGQLPEPCMWSDYVSEEADKGWTWHVEYDAAGNEIPSADKEQKKKNKKKKNEKI